ncbi:RPA-related protein RADX-like [Carcharodon carcharias]|uniref:RPA-related protein RADX-like n=1 Tax=Carcharodon carcharias TaxID=13397 RepID=UPI001B7E354C|nr:RPA-related protein RADX-like [Carcharodon carcharias]
MAVAESGSLHTGPGGTVFWVLAVERYLLGEPGSSRYDLTLCREGNGERAPLKCLLSPQLNRLVQRNLLHSGCQLRASRFSVLTDGLRVLERAEVLRGAAPPTVCVAVLPVPRPLLCCTKYYLPLWEESDYYGEEWIEETCSQELVNLEGLRIITLKELENTWRGRLKLAPLLVRIMYKSRLRHYGRAGKNVDWPYQAYFEVGDCSGMMSMVLWNSLCPRFFRSLEVGTVIFIQQYVVKDAFRMRTHPVLYYPNLKIYKEQDISLNPWKSAAAIKIIPPKQVQAEWRLPDITYRFITRYLLDTVPDTYVCDVIGLVTFVGRCERIRKKEDGDDFWVRRFVEMVDETSAKPFILELYCTSQPEIYNQLHPVTFLVCTQMRVVRNKFHNGCSIAYLTSSSETQIYITGYHKGRPYTTDTRVKRFIQWAKAQHERYFQKISVVGGYYSFPPLPSSFQDYSQNMKEVTLTSLQEFKEKVESLHYREHKHIVIQGIITAVKYTMHTMSIGYLIDKKPIQPVQTEKADNELDRYTSNEYKAKVTNNQSSRQDYLHNFSKTFQSFGQILEPEEVMCLAKDQYNLRSRKYEPIQTSTMKTSAPDLDPSLLSDSEETEDEYFTADEDIYEMDGVANSKPLNCSWESSKWSEIKSHVKEFLSFGHLLPESCPQKFEYAKKEAIMSQHNLHPSRYDSYLLDSSNNVRDVASAWSDGYYTLTIVDLIMGTVSELNGKHFLCTLDLYHHGNDQTEVILSRAYEKS